MPRLGRFSERRADDAASSKRVRQCILTRRERQRSRFCSTSVRIVDDTDSPALNSQIRLVARETAGVTRQQPLREGQNAHKNVAERTVVRV
jgi:hypothetical protein